MRQQSKQNPYRASGQAAAEQLAIRALVFLADDAQELGRFLALTGIETDDIRVAAQEPGFLAGVLEYICSHQPLLLAFGRAEGIDPAEIDRALGAISGKRWSRDVP